MAAEFERHVEEVIFRSAAILVNIQAVSTASITSKYTTIAKLVAFIVDNARGSYLYANHVMDLVAQSHLTVRAGNLCRWLPRNLSEVFHLRCSREFPTPESFSGVGRMLSICLAAARPLSPRDLAGILRERDGGATECGAAMVDNLRKMARMLQVQEGRVVFAHSSVRDWLQDDRHRYRTIGVERDSLCFETVA
jgi:hypothetical protein